MDIREEYLKFYKINFGQGRYCSKSWGLASYKAGQQSKQADIKRAVLSLRNEFNLWADDNEQFHAIEAQIEQLEELLK